MKNLAHGDVDMQPGFTIECPNELPVQETLEVLDVTMQVRNKFRAAGELVLRSGDLHQRGVNYAPWPRHCEVDTRWSQFIDGDIHTNDVILYKWFQYDHPFSLFAGHTLREKKNGWIQKDGKLWVPDESAYTILNKNDITTFVGTWVAGEFCEDTTLCDAVQINLETYAVTDGIAFFDPTKKKEFYEKWQDLGIKLITSRDIDRILAESKQ